MTDLITAPPSRARAVPNPGAGPVPELERLAERAAGIARAREASFTLAHDGGRRGLVACARGAGQGSADHDLPVQVGGEVVGLLSLRGCPEDALADGAGALREIARDAGASLAALLVATQRRRLAEATAVIDIGQSLTEVLFIEEVLLRVIGLAEALVLGHAAAIALRSGSDRMVVSHATGSLRPIEELVFPLAGSVLGSVTESGEGMLIDELLADPSGAPLETPLGPAAVVAIRVDGKAVGAFLVARLPAFAPFTEDDLATLQRLAAYAAIALQNAEIHEQQAARSRELQVAYQELEQSQDRLLSAEKMAALGRITAGIAHEINSPLGSILSSVRTARKLVEEYHASAGHDEVTADDHREIAADMARAVDLAQAAAERLGQFVRSIKSQTRAGDDTGARFDPAEEIDTVLLLLGSPLRQRNVAIFTELERGLSLRGDPGQFGMVVQNLVTNAADAYDGQAGEVWIRLRADGGFLRIAVQDAGSGIPEEIRGRIYDHLFTTKAVGKGTGLGLSMVHSLVTTAFGGTVTFESEAGVGTTFHIDLPVEAAESPDHGS